MMDKVRGLAIAIDGPAGAGKSTIARLLAQKLDYIYFDTGAMYRAVTLKALEMDNLEEKNLARIARSLNLRFVPGKDAQNRVFLGTREVTLDIRSPDVEKKVSLVASYPAVRNELVNKQRKMAENGGVVMDGRDIGTVVLPDADLKIFLTASLEERAYRRWIEKKARGEEVDIDQVTEELRKRDYFDSSREVSPLRKAPDAIEIDTTSLSREEVVSRILKWC